MDCPRCKEKMGNTNSSGIATATCLYCKGTWIGSRSIDRLLTMDPDAPGKIDIRKSFEEKAEENNARECPDCDKQALRVVHINGVEIDLCPSCNGVFFDEGELKEVLPRTHKPQNEPGAGGYVASEGLFWIIAGFFSGGGC